MPDEISHPPATPAPGNSRAGSWLVGGGYAVTLGAFVAAIVASILAWGETSSVALLASVVVLWLASAMIAYGRKLRGELGPGGFSVGRGIAALPVCLVLAYFAPAIEHFGAWWILLLPHLTYELLGHTIGLPHVLALVVTIVVALPEIFLAALVPQFLIVTPLSAIFGRDSPIVENVRELVGGVWVSYDDGTPASGLEESTVWGGESRLG
jgi:hypothetical protein